MDAFRFSGRILGGLAWLASPFARGLQRRTSAWFGNTCGPHVYGIIAGIFSLLSNGIIVAAALFVGWFLATSGGKEIHAAFTVKREYATGLMLSFGCVVMTLYLSNILWSHGRLLFFSVLRVFRSSGNLAAFLLAKYEPAVVVMTPSAPTVVETVVGPVRVPVSEGGPAHYAAPPSEPVAPALAHREEPVVDKVAVLAAPEPVAVPAATAPLSLDSLPGPTTV